MPCQCARVLHEHCILEWISSKKPLPAQCPFCRTHLVDVIVIDDAIPETNVVEFVVIDH